MAVKIRLTRLGRKKMPAYRLVAAHGKNQRDGKTLEILGIYQPLKKWVEFKKDRIDYWLSVGGQPTETVRRLLCAEGILEKPKTQKTSPYSGISKKDRKEMIAKGLKPGEKEKTDAPAKEVVEEKSK